LDIQVDARITVLNTPHWRWVLAKSEQVEARLNFYHVVTVKNTSTVT
jgi:hypothetical protein